MKNANRGPDAPFDRLLARALEARAAAEPAEIGAACVDAETVAAWADDTLSAPERAAVEAHAADCGRCQALMAAMVKTAPPPVATTSAWRLGWLIPAATVAAAILAWVIVPGRVSDERRDSVVVSSEPAASRPAVANPPGRLDSLAPPAKPGAPGGREETRAQPSTQERKLGRPSADKNAGDALAKAEASTNAAAQARPPDATADAPAASPQAAAKAAPAPFRADERDAAALGSVAPSTAIVSSDPSTRWRIVPGGRVQRSVDAGSTWETQETGATVTVSAGASPSASVCWLAGPAGTVLLSTDGRSWRRLVFPEPVPLISISATDDRTATVTAADGRRFSTVDGGLTWTKSGGI